MANNFSNNVTENRHEYIGASDIGVIMGAGLWKTPFELWCEKTQKIDPSKKFTKQQQEIMPLSQIKNNRILPLFILLYFNSKIFFKK